MGIVVEDLLGGAQTAHRTTIEREGSGLCWSPANVLYVGLDAAI